MATAEECKLLGNESVANKNWDAAYNHYLRGVGCLQPSESNLKVILTSNISLVLLQLSRYQEALDEAAKCMELDPKFEKGYLRYAAALEALNLKAGDASLDSCPVMKTYRKGLEINPGSTLLADAMKISFPFVNANIASKSKSSSKTKSSKASKKQLSGTAKAEREACVSLDIRGATGQHELRVNGRYDPTDELSGGWPMYRKRIEVIVGEDDEVDEDDNLILEFHSGLDEWMVKHVSSKGSHRSFVFLKCSPPTRPELCRSSSWQSKEDKKLTNQTSMSVLTISQRHDEDVAFFRRERDSCVTIEVRGALGRKALGINGVFEPTEDCCGGWPVYRKIADVEVDEDSKAKIPEAKDSCSTTNSSLPSVSPSSSSSSPPSTSVWMEYNPYFRSWQIKPTPCLGTNRSWGYSNTNTMQGTLPQLSRGVWEVLEEEDFRPQESICLMTISQWQIEDEKLAQLWTSSCPIDVRGATGTYGPIVNGVYDPLSTFTLGYQKRTDPKCVIEYSRMRKLWQLKCAQGPCAFVPDDSRTLPELCSAVWYVMVNGNWERQSTVKVSSLSSRKILDNDMYGDKLTDAVPLDVRGATGVNAFKINGVYEPIDEFSGGWPVYQRKGGVDYWLEYNEERGNWQIKSASHRGMDSAFAYVDSFPSKYPQKCGGTWWVYTGVRGASSNSGWEMQQSVTILSVADRTVEDMKSYEKRKVHCVPLDIRGATGPRGGGLNGVFDPTDEMRGGWPVYLKRDDGEWWLEYDACPQKWMIRPTPCRGTTRGRAYILCDPHTRPERAKGVWRLSDGKGGWAPEPTVQVISEADAMSQDKVLFDARRAMAVDIAIRGAIKPVGHINGIYEPTNESWHAWPIYKKKGCDTHYLEYHAPSSSWQVKPATVRGTKRCWAYVHSESEHPEHSIKSWLVIINGEHVKQDSIAITTLFDQTQSDKNLGIFRRKSCNPIKIRGAVGKHASVINGVYEPSLTELCGGWPVYYNNSSLKEEKSVGTKSLALKSNGINGSDDNGMGATKSFLLFCPYAMSWAITVLASVNDLTVSDGEELSAGMTVAAGSVSVVEASKALKEVKEKEREREKEKEKVHVDGKAAPASVTPRSLSATSASSSSSSKSFTAPTTPVKNSTTLPFYTPSSAPLTLAFFEVSTNTQPELALGTATWKVLSGAQFEPQLAIKVNVVADVNAPTTPPPVGITLKTITKLKSGATVVKSKTPVGSSQTAMNLTQIGVKSVEKKPIQEVIPDSPVPSSSFTRSTRNPVNDKTTGIGAISATLGAKDAKKNSWQDRSIVMVGPDIAPQAPQAVLRGISSPGLKLSVLDSNSDDGVGVSNSEVEDEWLEVKQKRAKGSSGASNVSAVRGGMSTPSASTLKGSSSRSSSPIATPTPTTPATPSVTPSTPLINGPDSFAAVLTAKKRDEGSASPPHPRFNSQNPPNPPNPPLGPSVQVPVVSTMGFKAAVMAGVLSSQSDPSAGTPSITSSYSSATGVSNPAVTSQKETLSGQSTRQSFSVDDFPAMPSSSSAQRLALATPAPSGAVLAGAAFAAAAAGASINQSTAALSPLGPATTPITITDITAIGTSKKLSKTKKKAGKFGTESALDVPKEGTAKEGNAENVPRNVLAVESDVTVDYAVSVDNGSTKLISDMISSSVPDSSTTDPDTSSSSYDNRSYSVPQLTASGADTISSTYTQPTLTAHGSYNTHITQGVYDNHSVGRDVDQGHLTGMDQGMDRNALNGSDSYIHGHNTGNAHNAHGTPHNHINGQVDHISLDNDEYSYMYQRLPKGDIDEDDEDLFKAISSANGIDFDPSFTANNLPRPIGSTLSPLSRRIGSRNELNNKNNNNNTIHNNNQSNLPRQSSSDNMRQSPYSSLLEAPGPPPIGPLGPMGPLSKAEGFLSGITFDLFSSLLQSNISEIAPINLMRNDTSILENISLINADVGASSHMSHRNDHSLPSSLEIMDLNNLQSGLSPLCDEYQYRGPLPEITDDQYDPDAHIARDIRYPMPALTPIPPTSLTNLTNHTNVTNLNPSSSFNHVDSSHMNYPHRGTLDLTRNLPQNLPQNLLSNPYNSTHSPPILFKARELSIATDNFSTNNLINIMDLKGQSDIIVKTGRAKAILEKEKKEMEKEREKELSMCTFVGLLRNNAVVIKIITPNTDSDINNTLQSQYLRELRVLCEVSHPNILPLFGYTFRPCARIYKIPSGIQSHDIYTDPALEIGVNGIKNSSSVGYYSLTCLLKNIDKRKKFSWKMRIRIIICIVRALSYLHIGDCDAGRCPIAHCNVNSGNIILENLEGEAYLTDFTQSKDLFPPIDEKIALEGVKSIDDGTEEDIRSMGIIFIQLLLGQWDRNHCDVLRVYGLFYPESDPKRLNGNRRNTDFRRKVSNSSLNSLSSALEPVDMDEIVSLAEGDIWPLLAIHRIAEFLTVLFSAYVDPNGSGGGGGVVKRVTKCEQLLIMLQRMWP